LITGLFGEILQQEEGGRVVSREKLLIDDGGGGGKGDVDRCPLSTSMPGRQDREIIEGGNLSSMSLFILHRRKEEKSLTKLGARKKWKQANPKGRHCPWQKVGKGRSEKKKTFVLDLGGLI